MNTQHFRISYAFLLLSLTIFVSACASGNSINPTNGSEIVSSLTPIEADSMLENAMQGFVDGDYDVWSQDWSEAMKGAISEDTFLSYRDQVVSQVGQLLHCDSAQLLAGENPGFVRWSKLCTFEEGQIKFDFGFANDGTLIEGVFPEVVE